jgi:hypothetical protein
MVTVHVACAAAINTLSRSEATSNMVVRLNARVADGAGSGHLEYLGIEDSSSGKSETVPAIALFALIGANPPTSACGYVPKPRRASKAK